MTYAAPRQKATGEADMLPQRIGTSSGTRCAACSSSSAMGSGRPGRGSQAAWLERGVCLR